MKKLLLLAFCLVILSGCLTTPNEEFVKGVDVLYKEIAPAYETYVQNDSTLNKDDKEIRISSSVRLKILIKDAKEEIKKGND